MARETTMRAISVVLLASLLGCGSSKANPQPDNPRESNEPARAKPVDKLPEEIPADKPPAATCIDFRTASTDQGKPVDCYPLRCRDGACLTECATAADCAGSSGPATLAEEGWPLRCQKSECVPLPPREVTGR